MCSALLILASMALAAIVLIGCIAYYAGSVDAYKQQIEMLIGYCELEVE